MKFFIILSVIFFILAALLITFGVLTYNYIFLYVIVGVPTFYVMVGSIGIGVALIVIAILLIVLVAKKG